MPSPPLSVLSERGSGAEHFAQLASLATLRCCSAQALRSGAGLVYSNATETVSSVRVDDGRNRCGEGADRAMPA